MTKNLEAEVVNVPKIDFNIIKQETKKKKEDQEIKNMQDKINELKPQKVQQKLQSQAEISINITVPETKSTPEIKVALHKPDETKPKSKYALQAQKVEEIKIEDK